MKAPINYFGGKNIMFKYIIEKFPNRETYDTYIEPFGGSYAVGLNMPYIPPIEIYNDLEKYVKNSGKDLKKFFNTSGMKYREYNLKEKLINMSEEEQLSLLASDGMLIKRPLLIIEDHVCVGFSEKEWSEFI